MIEEDFLFSFDTELRVSSTLHLPWYQPVYARIFNV